MALHRRSGTEHVALVQAFMTELLGQLHKCGLQTPEPFYLPEIVFHNCNRAFLGESLQRAVELGKQHFQQDPKIIFVLLPDTGTSFWADVVPSNGDNGQEHRLQVHAS